MVIFGRQLKFAVLAKVLYLLFLVSMFFYINSVLATDSFSATEKEEQKPTVKIKEVNIKLTVELTGQNKEYAAKLKNMDTVKDFLNDLRENQGLLYESDLYTYGVEIVSVFDQEADAGKRWAIYDKDKDITATLADHYLVNKTTYILRQVAK